MHENLSERSFTRSEIDVAAVFENNQGDKKKRPHDARHPGIFFRLVSSYKWQRWGPGRFSGRQQYNVFFRQPSRFQVRPNRRLIKTKGVGLK